MRLGGHLSMERSCLPIGRGEVKLQMAAVCLWFLVACGTAWSQAAVTKATIFRQIDKGNSLGFVIQIEGSNLLTPENPRVVLLPSEGVTSPGTPNYSGTVITMNFTASSTFVPLEVALSYSTGTVAKAVAGTDCAPDIDISKSYLLEPEEQVAKKYGHGVAKNFDVIQISIVNTCPLAVLVPLAGISVTSSTPVLHPFSLNHVTSIFSNDRTFSGPRAVFFNILQGAVTVGSAIEPFLASGFTKGVSIAGGGFTQGAANIWKDLSSEQLQNLTAQSFQATEQISANGGSLQKSIFFPRTKNKVNLALSASLKISRGTGSLDDLIKLQVIPVVTPAGK